VHRSDGSGTTSNFTKYLTAAAGSAWTLGSGDTVPWPTSTQGAEKNSGVATLISTTEGSIGYVDLSDAVSADLQLAEVKNAAGKFIAPTLEAASAALEGTALEENLTYDPLNAPGDTAYPITSPTWVLVYATQPDAAVGEALKGYLHFLLTDGQEFAGSVGYAKLPPVMVEKAIAQIDSIS
jgi:phosphate transport system substrate-binding protein